MNSILEKPCKLALLIQRNGASRLFHLGYATLLLPTLMEFLPWYADIRVRAHNLLRRINVERDLRRWKSRFEQLPEAGARGNPEGPEDVGQGAGGPGGGWPGSGVTLGSGRAGVQEHYGGDRLKFLNQLEVMYHLGQAGCRVPALLDVDFDRLTLTLSSIPGPVLTAADGADKALVDDLMAELHRVHACGCILHQMDYGDITIEERSGKPYLTGLGAARWHPHLGQRTLGVLRDRDVERFNRLFGAGKLTYRRARQAIRSEKRSRRDRWYAPVYFGAGLRIGPIWKVDRGYGRWHYILEDNLPPLAGKRVLDLGANNAFNAIQVLRHGAAEAIGIERNPEFIAQGNLVKAVFEWADNAQYNFRYVQADMAGLPAMELGQFDLVLALCCLYYLDDAAIARLIRHLSGITGTLVVQCSRAKSAAGRDPHIRARASLPYNLEALKSNGFGEVRVIAAQGYSRPLLIAHRDQSDAD